MTTPLVLELGQNRFRVAARTLAPEARLFEFKFFNFEDFRQNNLVKKAIERYPDFYQLSIAPYTRTWVTEKGKATKSFWHCMLERQNGNKWHEFGYFDKPVKELPVWTPPQD
jgi:hypothetical protein